MDVPGIAGSDGIGIPIIYQGQEQHYAGGRTPNNREALWLSGYSTSSELYAWVTKLNRVRAHAIDQDVGYVLDGSRPFYYDNHTIAVRKGRSGYKVVGVFTNVGSSSSHSVTLASEATGFESNQAVVDVMACHAYTTDSSGSVTLVLTDGLPRVLYPKARLSDSDICAGALPPGPTVAPPSSGKCSPIPGLPGCGWLGSSPGGTCGWRLTR